MNWIDWIRDIWNHIAKWIRQLDFDIYSYTPYEFEDDIESIKDSKDD